MHWHLNHRSRLAGNVAVANELNALSL